MDHVVNALQNVVEEDGERQPKRQKTESDSKAEDKLKFIPFNEWVDKLEMYMKVNQNMEKVVSSFCIIHSQRTAL